MAAKHCPFSIPPPVVICQVESSAGILVSGAFCPSFPDHAPTTQPPEITCFPLGHLAKEVACTPHAFGPLTLVKPFKAPDFHKPD